MYDALPQTRAYTLFVVHSERARGCSHIKHFLSAVYGVGAVLEVGLVLKKPEDVHCMYSTHYSFLALEQRSYSCLLHLAVNRCM